MDNTKEYIQMCENWDLQSDRVAQIGDYYVYSIRSGKDGEPFVVTKEYLYDPNYYTWLPRQDDLQEMILTKKEGWFITFDYDYGKNYKFTYDKEIRSAKEIKNERSDFYFDSLEKCYLALVMKEKHGATWMGTEWDKAHWKVLND